MKIKEIKYLKTFVPNSSCGTGYSEPNKFHVVGDDGIEKDIWIDIWYLPEDLIYNRVVETLKQEFDNIENIDEVFKMLKTKSCPYFWMNNE